MTGGLSKNFLRVGIGPLSEILAVKNLFWVERHENWPKPAHNSDCFSQINFIRWTLLAKQNQPNKKITEMQTS